MFQMKVLLQPKGQEKGEYGNITFNNILHHTQTHVALTSLELMKVREYSFCFLPLVQILFHRIRY